MPIDPPSDDLGHTCILRLWPVVPRVGLSPRTIARMEAAGRFPSAVRLAGRAKGWVESDVENWLQSRRHADAAP